MRGLAAVSVSLAVMSSAAATLQVEVRDAAGRALPDAAVYALPAAGGTDARPGRSASIEQVDREFVPYVTVVQAGTTVTFPNRDPILHHVYSFSPAKSFEIKLYSGMSPGGILFDKPGVVTLGCNIHDWMIGYVLVVATPHFARTDANGVAHMRDVPPGAYELHAWHPQQKASVEAKPIAVESAPVLAAFTMDVAPRRAKYKPPLDRLKY
jgi:plastocyanin